MSAPANDRISQKERGALRAVVRNQMKVLRAEVAQREIELLAEMEKRLVERYRGDDALANKMNREMDKIADKANAEVEKLKEKYEELFSGGQWYRPSKVSIGHLYRKTEDKAQLRRALETGVKAEVRKARISIDRQEVELLRDLSVDALESAAAREFLTRLPGSAAELMPLDRLVEIEARYDANPRMYA